MRRLLPLLIWGAHLVPPGYAVESPLPTIDSASCQTQDNYCRLGSVLHVKYRNLTDAGKQNVALVINGRLLRGQTARGPLEPGNDNTSGELQFDLTPIPAGSADTQANRDAWGELVAGGERYINISLSPGGSSPYYGSSWILFKPYPKRAWIAWIGIAVIWIGFVVAGINSDVLRDGPTPKATKPDDPTPKPMSFSLGRCQMAWWTVIIVSSFLYIWIVTLDWNVVPVSVLVLMGISSTTALGAVLVDSNRNDQRKALTDEKSTLSVRLDQIAMALRTAPANATDLQTERDQKQTRLSQVNAQLDSLPSPIGPTQGFLCDILIEEQGISLHRLQMAVWTVVLGIVFAFAVGHTLIMPEFNATLLALMGISSGTYIGFKIPDPPKPNQSQ